jgi:uncharacterized protein (TIGR03067 family)
MHALLLLTLLPSAPLGADKPKALPKELEELQGVWKITAMEQRGLARAPTARTANRYTLVVVGDAYVLNSQAGTLTVDPVKKTVDLKIIDGLYKGQTLPGLFELSGDTLQLAIPTPIRDGERPKELKTGTDTTHTLYVFERDKTATKEQAEAKLKDLREALPDSSPFTRGPTASDRATQELLRQVLEKLDRIEKRLDEMEKKAKDR